MWIAATQGTTLAAEYYAAYFLEESLSVDNVFVFAIVFSELHIPDQYQRRVLRYGILGALVFRAMAIGGGIALIERFRYGLAVILAFTGTKMLAANVVHISAAASVLVIGAVLLTTIALSFVLGSARERGTV